MESWQMLMQLMESNLWIRFNRMPLELRQEEVDKVLDSLLSMPKLVLL